MLLSEILMAAGRHRRVRGRWSPLGAALLLLTAAAPAVAQKIPIPENYGAPSPFNLRARGDYGVAGFRATGAASWAVSNVSGLAAPRGVGLREPRIFNTPTGTWFSSFEWPLIFAAPPSDLPEGINPGDLNGGGYTFTTNQVLATRREELLASDRSGRDLLALGIVGTDDGSCRDYTESTVAQLLNGALIAGFQLLPHLACTDTWPDPENWGGLSRITLDGFLAAQSTVDPTGTEDPFAFWRVPQELTTGRPLGDQATYGEFVDWSVDLLQRYPTVVPGGGGVTPILRGWPMGLTVRFDAFYFNLPGINNAFFTQYLIINDSEKVWGQGVDYDSIYVGIQRSPGNASQFQVFEVDLSRGLWLTRNCRAAVNAIPHPWYGAPNECGLPAAQEFYGAGAQGLMVLKSPIGDLRNKLLSDPASPFYNPAHPNAGDTITFNHSHGCTFITCSGATLDFSERAAFGMMSSTRPNVLDGRAPTDFDLAAYWNIFNSSEVYPELGDFNKFAPPGWDYNHDGIPDTVYIDQCGSKGCVPLGHDTLPGGLYNGSGQTAPMSIGPFALGAGDTVGLIFAYIADRDSASFHTTVQSVYDLYLSFFLVPEPAPAPTLSASATAVTGGPTGDTEVTVSWNERLARYEDPFLLQLAQNIEEADAATELGRIRALNPWIVDSLLARAADNVAAIYVFRSCDGGQSFTDDGDCNPDPVAAADETSKWNGIGWLPWETLDANETSFTDPDALGGLTYLYSIVTETRGASYNILLDGGPGEVPTDGSGNPICLPARCQATEYQFVPSILSPLNRTAGAPGVTSVYVPLSRRAGRLAASATVESSLGPALVPIEVNLTTGARDGTFRAVFADTFFVTTTITARDVGGGRLDTTNVQVTVVASGTPERTFSGTTILPMRGETLVSETTNTTPGDPPVVTTVLEHRLAAADQVSMLLLESTGGGSAPVFATASLGTGQTTPGTFLDAPDFPGFFMDVDASAGGDFREQVYLEADGDTIPDDIVTDQAISWLTGNATPLLTGDHAPQAYSQYRITWSDKPYGPGEEFAVGAGMQERVAQSLQSRTEATSSLSDPQLVQTINDALGEDLVTGLETYALPFTITNVTEGREVSIAVIQHNGTVLLGPGADTQRVVIPEGKWVPGDRLVLLESIDGQLMPTWDVVIGCTATLRVTCDATDATGYAGVAGPGIMQDIIYYRPLNPSTEFTLNVLGERLDVAARRADLSQIKVVPNPYVVFSPFERSASDRVIKFTHVPDAGRIRIYTVAGQFVQEITWNANDLNASGDLEWNLRTRENTELAYGLYIWVLQSEAGVARGKFVVIR